MGIQFDGNNNQYLYLNRKQLKKSNQPNNTGGKVEDTANTAPTPDSNQGKIGTGSWNTQQIKDAGLKLPNKYFICVYSDYYRFNPDEISKDFPNKNIMSLADLKNAIDELAQKNSSGVGSTVSWDDQVQEFIDDQLDLKSFDSEEELQEFCGEYYVDLKMNIIGEDNETITYEVKGPKDGGATALVYVKKSSNETVTQATPKNEPANVPPSSTNWDDQVQEFIDDQLDLKSFDSEEELQKFCGEYYVDLKMNIIGEDDETITYEVKGPKEGGATALIYVKKSSNETVAETAPETKGTEQTSLPVYASYAEGYEAACKFIEVAMKKNGLNDKNSGDTFWVSYSFIVDGKKYTESSAKTTGYNGIWSAGLGHIAMNSSYTRPVFDSPYVRETGGGFTNEEFIENLINEYMKNGYIKDYDKVSVGNGTSGSAYTLLKELIKRGELDSPASIKYFGS